MINYDVLILCKAMLAILSLGWLWHCFKEIKSFLLAVTRETGNQELFIGYYAGNWFTTRPQNSPIVQFDSTPSQSPTQP